ncbi:MAG: c-type cytochrome domain-containing protein [Acidobacteriota bacterium]
MKHSFVAALCLAAVALVSGPVSADSSPLLLAQASKDAPSYADVSKIFTERCVTCHSGPKAARSLKLDSYEGVMAGAKNNEPVVIPKNPAKSELLLRVQGKIKPKMPLNAPALSDEQIKTIEKWIEAGASS